METNPILFRDLTYIFVAAVLGGLLAWRLQLPLILGFVLGGIAISPFTPGPQLSDLHTFEVFAEVGVVLLMFSIGVEFSIPGAAAREMGGAGRRPSRDIAHAGHHDRDGKARGVEDYGRDCHRRGGLRGEHNGVGAVAE
jgi:hypothetical protein